MARDQPHVGHQLGQVVISSRVRGVPGLPVVAPRVAPLPVRGVSGLLVSVGAHEEHLVPGVYILHLLITICDQDTFAIRQLRQGFKAG